MPVRSDQREMATASGSAAQRVGDFAGQGRRPRHQEPARGGSGGRRADCRSGATRAIRYVQLPIGRLGRATKARRHRPCQASTWSTSKQLARRKTTFADSSRHASPWAAQIYDSARAGGKDHPYAIRILARAWIRVIWPCWLNHTSYDPARHGAAAALINRMRHEAGTGVSLM